jgi:hypothetical protein
MDYYIDVVDTWGRRIKRIEQAPVLEVECGDPSSSTRIAGLLPSDLTDMGHDYRLRFFLDGELQADVPIHTIDPQWGDIDRVILRRLVEFPEVLEVKGQQNFSTWNSTLTKAYVGAEISEMVKDAVSSVTGPLHYLVDHTAYPAGAQREYQKFLDRKGSLDELPVGGISSGHYVGSARIDISAAYAKDGDTIAGLEVDGVPWPDLRLMMIDTEEMSINSHTTKTHPEVATWSAEQYDASGYKQRAQAATDALQNLIDTYGIDYIELNWHRNAEGEFDDRVDAYGRYIGLVYGGGECFDAAMVELDHSDVYLYSDGTYLPSEMRLKEYFSYVGPAADSVKSTDVYLSAMDFENGIFGVLTMLAYAAGYVWRITVDGAVHFNAPDRPAAVWHYGIHRGAVSFRSDSRPVVNTIYLSGNPLSGLFKKTYTRTDSIDEFGTKSRSAPVYFLSVGADADKMAPNMLDDLAYPTPEGTLTDYGGNLAGLSVGELIEVRGGGVRRLTRELPGEWGGRFPGRHVFAVSRKTILVRNDRVDVKFNLTSPLRSVESPLTFMTRNQPAAANLYEFRLDADSVGLDFNYHID